MSHATSVDCARGSPKPEPSKVTDWPGAGSFGIHVSGGGGAGQGSGENAVDAWSCDRYMYDGSSASFQRLVALPSGSTAAAIGQAPMRGHEPTARSWP